MGRTSLKTAQKAANLLRIKPILTINKEGEISLNGFVKAFKKEEKIIGFLNNFQNLREIAIEYSGNKEEAEILKVKIESFFPKVPIYFSIAGPALGVHAGPNALAVSVLTN